MNDTNLTRKLPLLAWVLILACMSACGSASVADPPDAPRGCVRNVDCSAGMYCSASGTCTLDCVVASDCSPDRLCDDRGRCVLRATDGAVDVAPPKDATVPMDAREAGAVDETYHVAGSTEGTPRSNMAPEVSLRAGSCFRLPVSPYRVTGPQFGEPMGGGRFHGGDDVGANAGTRVTAVFTGIVVTAREVGTWGGLVEVRHALDGAVFYSVYGHLNPNALAARVGDTVNAGDLLGTVGIPAQNGGWPEHLHFAIFTGRYPTAGTLRAHVPTDELSAYNDPVPYLQSHEPATGCGACMNDCPTMGATRCLNATTQQQCGNYDTDSCLEWGSDIACTTGACSGSSCVTCSDECPSASTTRCLNATTQQQCGNYDTDSCLEWGSNVPCGVGGCVGNTCATCTNDCPSSGAMRCLNATTQQQCGNYDTDSCLEWGADLPCASGVCSGAACSACTNECTTSGTTRCQDAATQQQCGNYDTDSCLEWGSSVPCGAAGCVGNTCATCTNDCPSSGAMRCLNATTQQQCGNYDTDSCLEWGSSLACASGVCTGSSCATCTDECPSASMTRCLNATTQQRCGNYDTDTCTEWGSELTCGAAGCVAGACATCTNDCPTSGATRCNGSTQQQCGNHDTDPCLEWGADLACPSGVCTGNTCVSCTNECVTNATRCLNNATQQRCGNYDTDTCTEWGSDFTCASGPCAGGECGSCPPCQTWTGSSCAPMPNGVSCTDDGNSCTADQCSGGACMHPTMANDCGGRNCGMSPSNCFSCGSCTFPATCVSGLCMTTTTTVFQQNYDNASLFPDSSMGSITFSDGEQFYDAGGASFVRRGSSYRGAYALNFYLGSSGSPGNTTLSFPAPASSSQTLRITLWAYNPRPGSVSIEFIRAGGSAATRSVPYDSWTMITADVTSTLSTSQLILRLGSIPNSTSSFAFRIDEVVIERF